MQTTYKCTFRKIRGRKNSSFDIMNIRASYYFVRSKVDRATEGYIKKIVSDTYRLPLGSELRHFFQNEGEERKYFTSTLNIK